MYKSTTPPFAVAHLPPANIASHIMQGKKHVFVKYPTHEVVLPKLASISPLTLSEAVSAYGDDLFPSGNELRGSSNGWGSKKRIFVRDRVTRYSKPEYMGHNTMVKEYISEEEYDSLAGASN